MSRGQALVPPCAIARWLDGVRLPVALTGGTGFVGSHLVDALCEAGVRPRVLVRDASSPRWIGPRKVDWVVGDLEHGSALSQLVDGAGTVVHLAGLVRAGRAVDFDRVNHHGTTRLVEAVRGAAPSARLIHVSSLAAAGPSATTSGRGPEEEACPISAYGRSKLAAERAVSGLATTVQWTIIRPPAIYGPRDTDIFELFRMAAAGWMLVPAGERWVTVVHVSDVVRAIVAAAAAHAQGRILHVGEPEPYRFDELARTIAREGGASSRLVGVPPALVALVGAAGNLLQRMGYRRVAMTRDKARELLARHWTSRTRDSLEALGLDDGIPFAEGARQTWQWYREEGWLR